ncbi:MAG: hypothetical protein RXO24_07835 [Acidilobus sp.]
MRTKYKVALSLSAVALLVFIGLTVHAVSAFARHALSIIGGLFGYVLYDVSLIVSADLVYDGITRHFKTAKSKIAFGLGAIALSVLAGLAMHSISVHVTEAAQSVYDVFTVSFTLLISVILLDMVITEMKDIEYRAVMVMVSLGIALLLLNAGLLWHIAWALGKGLKVGFDFKALLVSSIISAFDTYGLEAFYFGGFIYPTGNVPKGRGHRQVRSEGD